MKTNFKDFRKAAFAVGLGLYLGKHVGQYVGAVIDGVAMFVLKPLKEKTDAKLAEIDEEVSQEEPSNN